MAKMIINGHECEFEGKKMVLEVALDNGIEIPHYCYHPGLSVVASCRICLGEVAQPNPRNDNKVELIPKLLPTCQTPAAEGMVVDTDSPKSIANQKAVMEYLLINHPLDCPVCDQAGECYLQDYSYDYGRAASRFEETKIKQPKKDLGPNVLLYADRCIMCSRCVRFTKEVTGTSEIGIFGRGAKEQIDVFPGKPLDNELASNVVDICPVGALLDKDFLMSMRVWNLETSPGIDGITASGDNISVEFNEGRIYRVKPRTNMEVNKWWISDEIRFGWKFVHSEDRFRMPMRRKQGVLEECNWNRAYADVNANLTGLVDGNGAGRLALLISPMLPSEEAYLLAKYVIGLDSEAVIGIGPVPHQGEDKTFPGGYTVYAEKCPNARGVRRAVGQLTGDVLEFDDFVKAIDNKQSAGVVVTGNYPSRWTPTNFVNICDTKFIVMIDTLPTYLSDRADVLLPGATWVEKAGSFENARGRLQSFPAAIPMLEMARSEGQIALDLMVLAGLCEPIRYDADKVRREMGDAFVSDIHHPSKTETKMSDLVYVEL